MTSLLWGHLALKYTDIFTYGEGTVNNFLINIFDECAAEFVYLSPQEK